MGFGEKKKKRLTGVAYCDNPKGKTEKKPNGMYEAANVGADAEVSKETVPGLCEIICGQTVALEGGSEGNWFFPLRQREKFVILKERGAGKRGWGRLGHR